MRQSMKVDDPMATVSCESLNAWVMPDPTETVAGFGCDVAGGKTSAPLPITEADWATLRVDITTNSEVIDHMAPMPECLVPPSPALVGVTDIGEPTLFAPSCGGWAWTGPDGVDQLWTPSADALAIIEAVG